MSADFTVDSEFASLIQPLSRDEHAQLEANLRAEGCREPLTVWADQSILLDGHNRYGICRTHNIEFTTCELFFPDRDAAKRWIITNQLGRRNLTPESISYLRGKLYREAEKQQGARTDLLPEKVSGSDTAKRLAEQFNVTDRTIRNDAAFSEELDALAEELGDDFRQDVLSRDNTEIKRTEVVDLARRAKNDPERRKAIVEKLRSKEAASVKDADRALRNEERAAEREKAIASASLDPDKWCKGDVCRIEELDLPENSIDMVFTDPPYHEEHLDLIGHLARVAARALKPGGLCLVCVGQMYLPRVIYDLNERLEYVWQFVVFHPFSQARCNSRAVFYNYRPILVFRKPGKLPHASEQPWVQDVVRGRRDKDEHDWQQDEDAPRQYIEAYTKPGDTVLEPFTGGGTTAAVCKALGRKCLYFDIAESAVSITRARLQKIQENAA
jgi:16S rRNA G966 N2-methylase RsmD